MRSHISSYQKGTEKKKWKKGVGEEERPKGEKQWEDSTEKPQDKEC